MGGGGGGGEAGGGQRAASGGTRAAQPSPQAGRGGGRGRAGQWEGQSPSLGAARRAHGIINVEVVLPFLLPPNTHTPSLRPSGPAFPLFCPLVTRCL